MIAVYAYPAVVRTWLRIDARHHYATRSIASNDNAASAA